MIYSITLIILAVWCIILTLRSRNMGATIQALLEVGEIHTTSIKAVNTRLSHTEGILGVEGE